MNRRLKIFFHDNCFDGAASAALFRDFYLQCQHPGAEVALVGVQHQLGDPFAAHDIDGDDNACVDFRFCQDSRMNWWFDHHASAFQPSSGRAMFEADVSGRKFYDPAAPSNTGYQVRVLRDNFGYECPTGFLEVIEWAEIIDSARFASPEAAIDLVEPALQLVAWLERNEHPELAQRFIEQLGKRPLAEIAACSWVREPLESILAEHAYAVALIGQLSVFEDGVVFFDLASERVATFNKFASYALHPDATYTVGVVRAPDRLRISVGSNPWRPELRRHHIATICERFGGGGHAVVGAVTLPIDDIERGREIAAAIRAELSTS